MVHLLPYSDYIITVQKIQSGGDRVPAGRVVEATGPAGRWRSRQEGVAVAYAIDRA